MTEFSRTSRYQRLLSIASLLPACLPVVGLSVAVAVALAAGAPAHAADGGDLRQIGTAAVDALEADGLNDAMTAFAAPPYADMGTGLHIWAVTPEGEVVFDMSEQTMPGEDISGLVLPGGVHVMNEITAAVADDRVLVWDGLLPHAVTGQLTASRIWCDAAQWPGNGADRTSAFVCAMDWPG